MSVYSDAVVTRVRPLLVFAFCLILFAANFNLAVAGKRKVSLSAVALNPTSLVGGNSSQATVALSSAAPSGGAVVSLTSSDSSVAAVPASVTVPAGATSANFTVSTRQVTASTSATISASYNQTKTGTLTVLADAAALGSVALNPSTTTGGSSSLGTVYLTASAPSSGAVVSLSSSNATVAAVPSSVTVPAGASSATFTTTTATVSSTTSVTISAGYASATQTATLTVTGTSQGGGTTYYVSPAGSDTYPGTQALPFQTIQKAANVVSPGDTVIVEDGIYTDTDGDRIVVKFQRGGTSAAKVTFRSEHRWGAKIDGQNNTSRTGIEFGSGADWIRLEGFEVYGVGNNSQTDGASGILVYNGGSNVEIVGNHIHDIGRACTDTPIGENAMFIGNQSGVLVEGNLIHDVGRFAPGENGCQPTTTNYQNHDHGIYINTASNVTVRNNIFYNCKRGWCIQIYPNAVSGILIHHNTFAFENPYRDGQIIVGADCASCQIENNISYGPHTAFIRFYLGTHTNFMVANNMVYAASLYNGTAISGVSFSSNWPYTDPLMVAPLSFDFQLSAGSPAIDTGLFIPSVVLDFNGVLRPQGAGYDVGAYERTP